MSEILLELKNFKAGLDEKVSAFSNGLDRLTRRLDAVEAEMSRGNYGGGGGAEHKGFIADVLGNPAFAEFKARGFKGRLALVLDDRNLLAEEKTVVTSAALGQATPGILTAERLPGVVGPGIRRRRVRDAFPQFVTRQNGLEWVRENVFTNASSPTAETISKPESDLTFVIDTVPSRTIATWIPMAKQAFDDAPGIADYLSARLLQGLADTLDYELIAGDGTGQHLSGLSTEATAYDTGLNVSGDTKLDTLNHAIGMLEDANMTPTAIFLHPKDWRAIQLVKTEEGGANKGVYLLGGPQVVTPALWGVEVIVTTAITPGTFYVVDGSRMVVVDRQSAVVEISSEHADFWVRNMLAVRAEMRVGFAVTRSDAAIYGAF